VRELVYHRLLLPAVERAPDKVTVIDGAFRATNAQHLDRVLRLTHALGAQLGVEPGEHFAVMSLNGHEYLELWHAAFLGAGVINPLNLRLAPKELAYILRDSGTKVCFADAFFAGAIDAVREEAGIEQVVLVGGGDVPHDSKYEELVAAGEPTVPDEPDENDPVVLMYTGGTTGLPKGVLLDHRAELLNLYHVAVALRFDESFVFLHQTPMFHAASMGGVLGIPACGGTSTFVPVFDAGQVLDVIERDTVSITVMVPTMIAMLLNHPDYRAERLATLEVLVYGASPMPGALLERLLAEHPQLDVYQGYGMTEASAQLTMLSADDHREGGSLLKSAGRPLFGVVLSIQDPDGRALPVGETGEVCARAGNFMREYWNKPEATEEAFRDGWYHTGDAGYVDERGYLYLVDRVKDMIVTGGENVYSVEVENAIVSHPDVTQVAVIGVPHEIWGEAVHAVVVVADGTTITEEEIIEHARTTIAGYKLPKTVELRSEPLPLSGAMKVLKRQLRADWEKAHRRGS
jgi:acyl-CoA synthetase (AMP-forming)/AMP-acid ligase II